MNKKKNWSARSRGKFERNVPPTNTDWNAVGKPIGDVLVAGDTDPGRRRDNNEDNYLCDPRRGLFIVCDGLGGMALGEVASAEAIRFLGEYLTSECIHTAMEAGKDAVIALFNEAAQEAHQAVLALAQVSPERKGMSTTVVMGLLGDRMLSLANLGDSRAYLVRDGRIESVTQDHTVAAGLVALGEITPTEARESSLRNNLTACLGSDRYRAPFQVQVRLHAEDRVVLCSDGLWDMLEDDEIARITRSAGSPAEAVSNLIRAANQAGGHDNITVIALFASAVSAVKSEAGVELQRETVASTMRGERKRNGRVLR